MSGNGVLSEAIGDVFTLPSIQGDFAEWRKGRSRYAVWALNVDGSQLQSLSRRFQAHMADFLLSGYCRQPHLTLSLCGFPSPDEKLHDDFGPTRFAAQLVALAEGRDGPFSLKLGRPDSFTSAAYFSVDDAGGEIARLRQLLALGASDDGFPYTPHVSFGLYRDTFPLRRMLKNMAELDFAAIARLEIDRVSWMTYEAAVIGGPLEIGCEFDLRTGKLHVPDEEKMCRYFGPGWRPVSFA